MNDTVVSVRGLQKQYTSHKRGDGFLEAVKSLFKRDKVTVDAVKDLSFTIREGELVGFLGPNGAGKSTTIKMLTGILHPTSGTINVAGYVPWDERKKYVQNIGVVFGQKSQLWWDLPPRDAFRINQKIYGIEEEDFQRRVDKMTEIMKVGHVVGKPTRDLSLGQRMKCEFIMASLHNPEILFLDEPTIGVDAYAKEEIRTFLQELNASDGTTIIITTHDMDDIEAVCDRLIIVDDGSKIYDGGLKALKDDFIRHKDVEYEYSKIVDETMYGSLLTRGTIIEETGSHVRIQIPKGPQVSKFVDGLMNCCELVDLEMSEPRLENIIKEIYEAGNRSLTTTGDGAPGRLPEGSTPVLPG